MKLKNDDLFGLVFAWQTAQISKLTAVNSIQMVQSSVQQELKLDKKTSSLGAQKTLVC